MKIFLSFVIAFVASVIITIIRNENLTLRTFSTALVAGIAAAIFTWSFSR